VTKLLSLNGVSPGDDEAHNTDLHRLTDRNLNTVKFHFNNLPGHIPSDHLDSSDASHSSENLNLQSLQRQIGEIDQQKILANFDSAIYEIVK
jgi:hypothetical protein